MYSTFAVQSGESARQQRLALVFPHVLLWSNRAVIHLENEDSRNDPTSRGRFGRTRRLYQIRIMRPILGTGQNAILKGGSMKDQIQHPEN